MCASTNSNTTTKNPKRNSNDSNKHNNNKCNNAENVALQAPVFRISFCGFYSTYVYWHSECSVTAKLHFPMLLQECGALEILTRAPKNLLNYRIIVIRTLTMTINDQ